ncbi:hypothetical protein BGZ63DRAFT_387257 [Mariannaea sp. PMI_226]|nr:hypothetical protein BGZ63DRAFT_387257 [Mariannaea sp. PMI_226]
MFDAKIVRAPQPPGQFKWPSIFLAGTISAPGEPDWREDVSKALAYQPLVIFNPKRDDWDSTWKESLSDSRWAEQIQWELDMQDQATIVAVFFDATTDAPTSLSEMGLAARAGKLIACALDGYSKRGYVEAVCRQYKATFVTTEEDFKMAVRSKMVEICDADQARHKRGE